MLRFTSAGCCSPSGSGTCDGSAPSAAGEPRDSEFRAPRRALVAAGASTLLRGFFLQSLVRRFVAESFAGGVLQRGGRYLRRMAGGGDVAEG